MVSRDGVAPSRMVGVSASVNLPLHHKVQNYSSGTGSPGWSRKKGHKTVVVVVVGLQAECNRKNQKESWTHESMVVTIHGSLVLWLCALCLLYVQVHAQVPVDP